MCIRDSVKPCELDRELAAAVARLPAEREQPARKLEEGEQHAAAVAQHCCARGTVSDGDAAASGQANIVSPRHRAAALALFGLRGKRGQGAHGRRSAGTATPYEGRVR